MMLLAPASLDQELSPFKRALDGEQQLVGIERRREIEGAMLQSLDCSLPHRAPGDDDDCHLWVLLADLLDDLVAKVKIGDD